MIDGHATDVLGDDFVPSLDGGRERLLTDLIDDGFLTILKVDGKVVAHVWGMTWGWTNLGDDELRWRFEGTLKHDPRVAIVTPIREGD